MSRTRRSRWSGPSGSIAGLLVVAAIASACGSGPTKSGSGSDVSAGLPTGKPQAVLSAAAAGAGAIRTARMGIDISVDMSGLSASGDQKVTIRGTGAFDLAHRASQMHLNLSQAAGGKSFNLIVLGSTVYLETTTLGLSGAKHWITVTPPQGSGFDYTHVGDTAFSGARLLSSLQDVTVVGNGTVKGVPTTHYRGTLDMSRAMSALSSSGGAGFGQFGSMSGAMAKALAGQTVPVEAWIDGQNHLRRMTMSMNLAALIKAVMEAFGGASSSSTLPANLKADLTMDFTLYDLDAPLTITPPPPNEVGPAPAGFHLPGSTA